jgi:hypothetical protein
MPAFKRPGTYRRRLQVTTGPGIAVAMLEDDPHCYRVSIEHDGQCVTAIRADTIRVPWTTCRRAALQLDQLVGLPLQHSAPGVRELTDPSQQCTHMLDTAVLAIAHAARGIARRRYDVSVEAFDTETPQQVQVAVDGATVFSGAFHTAVHDMISHIEFVEPAEMRGVTAKGLYQWAQGHYTDEDQLELMWVLRRGVYISGSRTQDLDELQFAIETNPGFGACYVFQPGIAEVAARVPGTTRDFSDPSRLQGWEAVRIDPVP